jgi:phosphoenolpyruvate---glycerone phosphotransferase subunit DhaL
VITESAVDAATVTAWLTEAAVAIRAERDYLTQLDAAIGDGDHGTNMDRGFTAVSAALESAEDGLAPGKILILAGKTLVSTVGGASGPLWGSALRRAGRSLGDRDAFTREDLADAFDAANEAVAELGAAAAGDKTMLDALLPAAAALRGETELVAAVSAAADAAEEGAKATIPMQARRGRASYLGERSIGHQDPGATSAVLILRALERAVAAAG